VGGFVLNSWVSAKEAANLKTNLKEVMLSEVETSHLLRFFDYAQNDYQ